MCELSRLTIFGLLALGACATAPVAEVHSFATAVNSFNAASQPLLDELAAAERRQQADILGGPHPTAGALAGSGDPDRPLDVLTIQRRDKEVSVVIELPPAGASYFAAIADPPATRDFRRGVNALNHYAAVLVLLAEGRNIEAARAELGLLANNVVAVTAMSGGTALPVASALAALQPIIDRAAEAQNAAELKRLVLDAKAQIDELNGALRVRADQMFRTLIDQDVTTITRSDSPDVIEPALARIEARRAAVADWVVQLALIDEAMDRLVVAVENPADMGSLTGLADLSSRIRTYAEASRRALAAFRAEAAPPLG